MVVAESNQKSIEQIYQKKTQLEHILLRPDSYVGSVEATEYRQIWLLNAAGDQMERRNITVVPALYKIFDEIIVNAADNKQRDPENMDTMKVDINREAGEISVYNNGRAIPVQIHSEHNCYVPELIFGHLLTSSNYDDDQKKTTGGRNGYGAKLTNIYSTKFIVETNDCHSGKYFKQIFEKNMSAKSEPTVKKATTSSDWTRITFRPDFAKFGMEEFDNDIYDLMVKRVYDVAGCTDKSVKVYLNGTKLKIRNFKDYVDMYLPEGSDTKRVYDDSFDRWQVCVAASEGTFEQVSFVNSIWTIKGGKHVDYITDQITKGALAAIMKKKGAPKTLKPSHIKNHIFIFVNALIENPAFDSQTKENMTSNTKTFGSKCEISENFLKKILDVGIRDAVLSWSKFRETKDLKKNDGSKKSKILGIPKLDDANWAGTKNSQQCTLILTEGDSAKALAVSGLSIIGRDKYGVFPLKGKLLNVREATGQQILKNEEICNIKKILGLQQGVNYTDTSKLRYGHLMIMTDQDQDGSHIKGLLINFLHTFWPSLLRMNTFLSQFITPIVKVTKGNRSISFYTIPEYQEWRLQHPSGWKIKYFKGLGTSTSKDAKDYFSAIDKHQVWFKWDSSMDGKLNDDAIEKAFSKKRVEDRKTWLSNVEDGTFIDYRRGQVSYQEFVDRELVLFSQSDNVRSIPSLLDGLKPGQRKIIYGCFKRKLTGEIKVAQLAGYVAEHSAYHHGEQSLTATIINLAQNYCGSNNINLLLPNGQFGTRHCLGKDAASPRYIFTGLSPVTRALFPEQDDPLLHYLDDDGMKIEPKYYVPIIPMVLVNGAEGIGTGWSTSIPQYNPRDLVEWVKSRITDSPNRPVLIPWYKNFLGSINSIESNNQTKRFEMFGVVQRHQRSFSILEIPVNKSTDSYKAMLEEKDEKKDILGFQARHTDIRVDFTVDVGEGIDCPFSSASEAEIIKKFKLSNTIATSNMILFDADGQIKHYYNVEQILEEHYVVRNDMYVLRKEHMMSVLQRQCKRLDNKARFILGCIREEIHIRNVPRVRIEEMLEKQGFDRLPGPSYDTKMIILKHNIRLDDGDDDTDTLNASFDYLLNMPLLSLTKEKVEELVTELENKRKEIDVLEKTSPRDMWLTDLDNFLKILNIHETAEETEQKQADSELAKKTKRQSPHTALIAAAKSRKLTYQPASVCSAEIHVRDFNVQELECVSDAENMPRNSTSAVTVRAAKSKVLKPNRSTKGSKCKSSTDDIISDAFSDLDVLGFNSTEVNAKPRTKGGPSRSALKLEALSEDDESDDLVIIKSQTKKLSLSERLAQKSISNAATSKRAMTSSTVAPPVQKKSKPSPSSDSKSDPFSIDEEDLAPKKPVASKARASSSSKAAQKLKPVAKSAVSRSAKPKAKAKTALDSDDNNDVIVLSDSKSDNSPIAASRQRRAVKSKAIYVIDSDENSEENGSESDNFSAENDDDDEEF